MLVAAQCIMVLTLLLMISGKTPLYTTAIVGSAISTLVAGFPITGGKGVISLMSLVNGGLNPVIADMTGILMFIGVMQASGFLDIIIRNIVKLGNKLGGGAGVATAGGIAAGVIGMLTGFTQPAITAVITGTASTKLGVDPHRSAGIHGHAGILGNYGGFTHPTQVAVIAVTNIGFGLINVIGTLVSLCVFACALFRLRRMQKREGVSISKEEMERISKEFEINNSGIPAWKAFLPFVMLFAGFILGYPVFIVGIASAIFTMLLSALSLQEGEHNMLEGVSKIATPLVATIGFLFMSGVIKQIGLAAVIGDIFTPMLTQSNAASVAITIPFLQAALSLGTASPLSLAVMAAGGSAMLQYYLTGGPVAALATVIPVIPNSELKAANKFQRPNMLFGLVILFILSFVFSIF